jgi:OPA family glycerol-3-phosphate transporter-like MFS transporter
VPTLFLTAICDYATALVHSPVQLLIARTVLLFIEGAAVTTTAGLVRDFSPRLGRGTAFAFWTWGPIGANFLAAGIAGATLPIFTTWRSQFIIIGTIALVTSVVITRYIADLSPQLRGRVISTEAEMSTVEPVGGEVQLGRVRELVRSRVVLAHITGITLWQLFYWTVQVFGTTILVQTFNMSNSKAATIISINWACNLFALYGAGWLSDRLRVRKPLILIGAVVGLGAMAYNAQLVGSGTATVTQIVLTNIVLGSALALAYAPWMALSRRTWRTSAPTCRRPRGGCSG